MVNCAISTTHMWGWLKSVLEIDSIEQHAHHNEDQILGKFADDLVRCVNGAHKGFDNFGHSDPSAWVC